MKLVFNDYKYLQNILADMAIVVEDSALSDDAKNVVFKADEGNLTLLGTNKLITYKIPIPQDKVEVQEEGYIQTRCKDLINFLNTYKVLARTEIQTIELEIVGISVQVKVVEKDLNSDKVFASTYLLDNIPVSQDMKNILLISKPTTELVSIDTKDLKWFTDNFLSGLSSTADMYGSIILTDENCIVLNPAYTLIGNNPCGNTPLQSLRLSRKIMNFISKVVVRDEKIQLTKSDRNLYLVLGDGSEVFFVYNADMPPYRMYLSMINTEHMIKLDRLYLKDILKRVSLLHENIMFDIDCNEKKITIRNTKFNQSIPMLDYSDINGFDNIRFRIMPDVIEKIMLETDKNEDFIFMYYTQKEGNNMILLSNESHSWYSVVRVKTL